MFGYVQANFAALTEEQKVRYRSLYCGLCRRLGEKYGVKAHFTLSFDMVMLILMINGLYEPEEERGQTRCVLHPVKPRPTAVSEATDYAADISVILCRHKLTDDELDDNSTVARIGEKALSKAYAKAKSLHPAKTEAIEGILQRHRALEREKCGLDACANCFGELMGVVFDYGTDRWAEKLSDFGASLGRLIYALDAFDDFKKDKKRGKYNPLESDADRSALTMLAAECAGKYERLPIVLDAGIIENILYSGVWTRMGKDKK